MKIIHLLAFTGILSLFHHSVRSQNAWTELTLPAGAYIYNDFLLHHGKVFTSQYASNSLQVASTSDYLNWNAGPMLSAAASYGSSKTYSNGERLFLLGVHFTANSTAWYSDNDGVTWAQLTLPAPKVQLLYSDANIVIAADTKNVFRSTDGGLTWAPVLETSTKIADIKKSVNGQLIISTPSDFYRSEDNGLTWTTEVAPMGTVTTNFPKLKLFPTHAGVFLEYFKDSITIVYHSTDDGATWNIQNFPLLEGNYNYLYTVFSVGDTLWSIMGNSIARSVDGGLNWEPKLTPDGTYNLLAKGDTLFAGGSNGFYKSYNTAKTWKTGNLGWETFSQPSTFLSPVKCVGYAYDQLFASISNHIITTKDDGYEWEILTDRGYFNYVFTSGDTIAFFGYGVARSFDKGQTWDYFSSEDYEGNPISGNRDFYKVGSYFFAWSWTDQYIFRSADWGATWTTLSNTPSFLSGIASGGGKLYYYDYDGIKVSSNYGNSFISANQGLSGSAFVDGIYGSPERAYVLLDDQFYRRDGNLWKTASVGLYDDFGNLPQVVFVTGNASTEFLFGYTSSFQPVMYQSVDGGKSWEGNLIEGLDIANFASLALSNTDMYVAGQDYADFNDHIWKIGLTVGASQPALNAIHFEIVPNPVSTVLTVRTGDTGHKGLNGGITDISGRVLRSFEVPAGQVLTTVATDQLLPGVYIVQLTNSLGQTARQRMVVAGL